MSATTIEINLFNNSNYPMDFYFFQEPATYIGGDKVYSNSLLNYKLAPSSLGAMFKFQLELQYYAGVQPVTQPLVTGQPSGYPSAIQEISLTPAHGVATNCTTMQIEPLGLTPQSIVASEPAVQPGAFRIVTPVYNSEITAYLGGAAVALNDGSVILSNFTKLTPNNFLDCQPVLKFYVATGSYKSGTVMNFSAASVTAALCDATKGNTVFRVDYDSTGQFTTQTYSPV